MGHETNLQALPANWEIFRQACSGEVSGDEFQSALLYLRRISRQKKNSDMRACMFSTLDDDERLVPEATLKLALEFPGLPWRHCDLDRKFEILLYLLGETTSCDKKLELFDYAIKGQRRIHPSVTACQGRPIMSTDNPTNKRIYEVLLPIEFCELAEHFGTEKYRSQTLYKQLQNDDWRSLRWMQYAYAQLKEYYRAVVASAEITIVIDD